MRLMRCSLMASSRYRIRLRVCRLRSIVAAATESLLAADSTAKAQADEMINRDLYDSIANLRASLKQVLSENESVRTSAAPSLLSLGV